MGPVTGSGSLADLRSVLGAGEDVSVQTFSGMGCYPKCLNHGFRVDIFPVTFFLMYLAPAVDHILLEVF